MSVTVPDSFVKQYEGEVHTHYQQMGSKLRNTVRTKDNVQGSSCIFQKVGKGTASTKARHGKVPVMNVDHATVECQLYDYYAGDWVDQLDEFKTNINEKQVLVKAGAYALGRKTDELVIAQLDTSTNYALDGTTALTKAKVLEAFEMLGAADIPDDGERFAIIGWKQWSDRLAIDEFANADYVGPEALPWQGTQAKKWLGTLWMPHTGLTKSGSVRYCYWYHKTAIGHASGANIKSDVTWHGDRAAFFVSNMMSQGAALIDETGVVSLRCLES
ncbi:MAG: hypothetical protein HZC25_10425 [Rhodospirillales bacterium]|nr:hypothetical protein [Rhodospirillales bacterium]